MLSPVIFLISLFPLFYTPGGRVVEEVDLGAIFHQYEVEGCFVLLDNENNKLIEYIPERCREGFIPKSTFKIPHALIALEEGVLRDEKQMIPWDGTRHPVEAWNQDQTLASAIKYSCVWFFSQLTNQIDSLTYKNYLEKFHYGNEEVFGPPDHFWLNGKLRITAEEQVEFLDRFYHHRLGTADRSIDLVKKLIILEEDEDYTFYGKTGGGQLNADNNIMWLVGFIEKKDHVRFFAMNFTCAEFNQEIASARMKITRSVLKKIGIL